MLEPKALFASKGEVPVGEHYVPFGVARIARAGTDITIVAAGQMVQRALEAAETLAAAGHRCEVIDLRTIMPLDVDTIVASVRKTHRLLVVDEAWAMCGIGGEIAQAINELAFDELDAPVGPAAHRADLASVRAGAGTRHAGRRRPHRAGRARRHRRHAAGAGSLVHGRHQERGAGTAVAVRPCA